ncbi:MAG: alkaline phosphatase family protein [Pseudolysinimonas sp.]|uniref:alkaline phosphatase family protein n=1 Tax=Pseudolysinimonas sp. TaxID=2680009 RepID=UPI003C730AB2
MLPAAKTHRFSLTDVLSNCLSSVLGERGNLSLPPVQHAVVLLVDGLGSVALEAHRGYARRLLAAPRADVIQTVFPSTTASALASLTTGVLPGVHGLIGYLGFDSSGDRVINQLTGWGGDLDPGSWQRVPTLFEQAAADGVPAFAVGPGRYRDSGFTAAVLRGAVYHPGESIGARLAEVARIHGTHERSLSYVYAPELDVVAHAKGIASDAWVAALEEVDAAVGTFAGTLGPRTGLLVTGDHGGLDIPREHHVMVDADLLEGVRHVSGEPRCLALHLERGADAAAVLQRWRAVEGGRAWIATRDEVVAAGFFGDVDPDVTPRIGDIIVAARKRIAYYLDENDRGRTMIGQHGSLTPEETHIPLLRFGAFAS